MYLENIVQVFDEFWNFVGSIEILGHYYYKTMVHLNIDIIIIENELKYQEYKVR